MPALAELSLEIVDRILFALDPLDVARLSQVSRFFHEITYGPLSQQFWRALYLAQPLDDPRRTVTHLGAPRHDIDWRGELQAITRARTVIRQPALCRPDERPHVLRACIDLATRLPPIASPDDHCPAPHNVRWLQRHLGDGTSLEPSAWATPGVGVGVGAGAALSRETEQLLARLHALYGLTPHDLDRQRRRASQAFVYSHRHHSAERGYGPFLPDGSGRVDWRFVLALVHGFGMLLLDTDAGGEGRVCPMGIAFCQSVIPPGVSLDTEDDWAGVEGFWAVRYGFMDHREFILYNDPSIPEHEPQDTSIFDGTDEMLATVDVYFRVQGTEPDPSHPTRPKIHVVGEVDGRFSLVGFVKLTDDDQLWWHFGAGNDNQMVWNCDGVGLGSVRSQSGVIGVWSTVFHDVEDPIGPFWMRREPLVDEE